MGSRLVDVISALSIGHGRITSDRGSSRLWDCWVLFFGRLFGAHTVHKTLQMAWFRANQRTLSDSKQLKLGVYEQGRKISKPPFVECECVGLVSQFSKAHALATKEYAA
jgi:hypothetical protein